MSIRLDCPSCRAAFLTADDRLGQSITCPKCGAEQVVPSTVLEGGSTGEAGSAWIPRADEPDNDRPRRRWLLPSALALFTLLAVATLIAWPRLRDWWRPPPPTDPTERVALEYLQALTRDDTESVRRLGTIEVPPAIRSFEPPKHNSARDRTIVGSFAPIAALHARIDQDYLYDPAIDRYQRKNPLGAAAETLDVLHEAKAKAEQEKMYEKLSSADLDTVVDAVTQYGQTFKQLAEKTLAPVKLVPTYAQLVAESKPPLPPAEGELVGAYATDRATWDALLKRPFLTLRADGPFRLERAEVHASVVDKLASSGAPPSHLRLTLTRFRLEGIDTGWKVTSARREGEVELPAPRWEPGPATRSPGERPALSP